MDQHAERALSHLHNRRQHGGAPGLCGTLHAAASCWRLLAPDAGPGHKDRMHAPSPRIDHPMQSMAVYHTKLMLIYMQDTRPWGEVGCPSVCAHALHLVDIALTKTGKQPRLGSSRVTISNAGIAKSAG